MTADKQKLDQIRERLTAWSDQGLNSTDVLQQIWAILEEPQPITWVQGWVPNLDGLSDSEKLEYPPYIIAHTDPQALRDEVLQRHAQIFLSYYVYPDCPDLCEDFYAYLRNNGYTTFHINGPTLELAAL